MQDGDILNFTDEEITTFNLMKKYKQDFKKVVSKEKMIKFIEDCVNENTIFKFNSERAKTLLKNNVPMASLVINNSEFSKIYPNKFEEYKNYVSEKNENREIDVITSIAHTHICSAFVDKVFNYFDEIEKTIPPEKKEIFELIIFSFCQITVNVNNSFDKKTVLVEFLC